MGDEAHVLSDDSHRALDGIKRAVAVLCVILTALGCVVIWIAVFAGPQVDRIARRADKNASLLAQLQRSEHDRCQNGNDFRKADRARWEFILRLTAGTATSPEELARRAQFVQYINAADAAKPCN